MINKENITPDDNSSQRENGFRGGVQKGTSATTAHSRAMEIAVREAKNRHDIQMIASSIGLTWVEGLSQKKLGDILGVNHSLLVGCYPDGGIWMDSDGLPVIAAEAKRQGKTGNAIERISKNISILKSINPDILFITFTRGDGFFDLNSAERILSSLFLVENKGSDIPVDKMWNHHLGVNIRLYRIKDSCDPVKCSMMVKDAVMTAFHDYQERND